MEAAQRLEPGDPFPDLELEGWDRLALGRGERREYLGLRTEDILSALRSEGA